MNWEQVFAEFIKTHNSAFVQIDSYNYMINNLIPRIFIESPKISLNIDNVLSYEIIFGNSYVSNPSISEGETTRDIFPHETRLRDLTYESVVSIDICILTKSAGEIVKKENFHKIPIIKIPTMLRSCVCNLTKWPAGHHFECQNDDGGYFIIKGKERVLIAQERALYNYPILSKYKDKKYKFAVEFRSMSETTGHSIATKCLMKENDREIFFQIPYIKELLPLKVVLAYFEVDFNEIIFLLSPINEFMIKCLYYCFEEYKEINTKSDALRYILNTEKFITVKGDDKIKYIQQVFMIELFPHIPIYSRKEFVFWLSQIIRKILFATFAGRELDDKDHLRLKRVDSAGVLMYDIIRSLWKKTMVELFHNCKRKPNSDIFNSKLTTMSEYLRKCFSKGQWGLPNNSHQRIGVCQLLTRLSYASTISHIRKTSIPAIKNSKKSQIRQLHQSHIGMFCPASTPEGRHAGLVKNISTMTFITNDISHFAIFDIIKLFDSFNNSKILPLDFPICINGQLAGYAPDEKKFIEQFNESYMIQVYESISAYVDYIDHMIFIYSDAGRLMRPAFYVNFEKQQINISAGTWEDLVRAGEIRYIDQYAAEGNVIAFYPTEMRAGETKYNYCEIHPCIMLSYETQMIPFPDHSQSPRNTYESCMLKQAIGWNLNSIQYRFEKTMFILNYLQKNLIPTIPSNILKMEEMPSGINVIVGICPFHGFNQEDSVVLNRASIDRGLFRATCFKTISDEEKRHETSVYEKIEIPDSTMVKRRVQYNYNKLGNDGIVPVGTYVCKDDVVIGKVLYRTRKIGENEDCSVAIKHNEEGVIDSVMVTTNVSGKMLVKIRVRSEYIPIIGDKFASNTGQKGTCGMIYNSEDLPFTADGIVPDIIINPLCIPSRMTINQLIEMVLGKDMLITGKKYDSTPFTDFSYSLEEYLKDKRFTSSREVMYSGITGKPLESLIMIGPTYYHRLKHNVIDKMHARNGGGIQSLTRQPLEGRSRSGGLKFGEMETLVVSGHGASNFLRERLYDVSDPFVVYICSECGFMVNSTVYCAACDNTDVRKTCLPYASKLLFQYMMSCGIKIKFNTEIY